MSRFNAGIPATPPSHQSGIDASGAVKRTANLCGRLALYDAIQTDYR